VTDPTAVEVTVVVRAVVEPPTTGLVAVTELTVNDSLVVAGLGLEVKLLVVEDTVWVAVVVAED